MSSSRKIASEMASQSSTRDSLGVNAPPKDLRYPPTARMTAVELLTFLPYSLKSPSVVYRLISNGMERRDLWAIINTNRRFEKPWPVNSCGVLIYKTMRKAGFNEWTISDHYRWHRLNEARWNPNDLFVGTFKLPCESGDSGAVAAPIPFAQLAEGVRRFPEGNDALDLTRMVLYARANPHKKWMYPDDYATLLKFIGGPASVTPAHIDSAVHRRWIEVDPPSHTAPAPLIPTAFSSASSSAMPLEAMREHLPTSPIPHRVMREEQERRRQQRGMHERAEKQLQIEITEESRRDSRFRLHEQRARFSGFHKPEIPSYRQVREANGHKWRQETKNEIRRRETLTMDPAAVSPRSTDEAAILIEEDSPGEVFEPYERGHAIFVPPRTQKYSQPTAKQLVDLFLKEGNTKEGDVFSAYAFGGPRTEPPFRPVHLMNLPAETDVNGWAENIRWVKYQVENFPAIARTGWDESPEHMQVIAELRVQQQWVSDTWLKRYEKQHQDKLDSLGAWMPPRRPKEMIELQPAKVDLEQLRMWFISNWQPAPVVAEETFFDGKHDPYTGPLVPTEGWTAI